MPVSGISSSSNPYVGSTYTAETNDRNSLDITDYFQLIFNSFMFCP